MNGYKLNDKLALLFFFFVTLLVYYKSLFGTFIFDDVIVILQEPLLKKENFFDFLKGLPLKERPIRLLTFYLDKQIWGLNPFGYRFTNLIIHIGNGFLLFHLFQKLGFKKEFAFFSSAFFLWHFSNPATVCYVTGRKDLLGFFFIIISALFLINYKEDRRLMKLLFSFLFFFFAIFTKEMFITFPLIIFAYLYIVEGKRVQLKYLVLASVIVVVFTIYVIKFRDVSVGSLYKRLSIPEYFVGYLRLYFDPTFPKVDYIGYFSEPYSFKDINWMIFSTSSFVMVVYFIIANYFRKKDKFLSFLFVSFFISLLPVLQIIQHSESFAEHYFYFPSVFLSVIVVSFILKMVKEKIGIAVLTMILIILIPYTHKRTEIFNSEDNFWLEAYKRNPKSYRAKQYYGQMLLSENRVEEAKKLFEEGLQQTSKLYNVSELAYTYYYDFLNNLALCAIVDGDFKKAEYYYLKGLQTIPESTKKELFIFNLSVVYLKENRDKAKKFMKSVILKNPNYKEITYLFYDVYWQDGQMNELERFIDEVLQKDTKNYFALAKKILFLFKKGEKERGLEFYKKLKELSPSNYYELNDTAEIEMFLGNYNKAREYLLMALEEKPSYGRTKKNLKILEEKSKMDKY